MILKSWNKKVFKRYFPASERGVKNSYTRSPLIASSAESVRVITFWAKTAPSVNVINTQSSVVYAADGRVLRERFA